LDPVIVIFAIVIALLGGLALGWFIGGKPAKDAAQATSATRREPNWPPCRPTPAIMKSRCSS
jgi:flagellar basal body-associated protein FliL